MFISESDYILYHHHHPQIKQNKKKNPTPWKKE